MLLLLCCCCCCYYYYYSDTFVIVVVFVVIVVVAVVVDRIEDGTLVLFICSIDLICGYLEIRVCVYVCVRLCVAGMWNLFVFLCCWWSIFSLALSCFLDLFLRRSSIPTSFFAYTHTNTNTNIATTTTRACE